MASPYKWKWRCSFLNNLIILVAPLTLWLVDCALIHHMLKTGSRRGICKFTFIVIELIMTYIMVGASWYGATCLKTGLGLGTTKALHLFERCMTEAMFPKIWGEDECFIKTATPKITNNSWRSCITQSWIPRLDYYWNCEFIRGTSHNLGELKTNCQEQWPKIVPKSCKKLLTVDVSKLYLPTLALQQNPKVYNFVWILFKTYVLMLMNAYFFICIRTKVKRYYLCKCEMDICIGSIINNKNVNFLVTYVFCLTLYIL